MIKKASWNQTKAIYEIPFQIMQLEREIETTAKELKKMREKLNQLKKKEYKG